MTFASNALSNAFLCVSMSTWCCIIFIYENHFIFVALWPPLLPICSMCFTFFLSLVLLLYLYLSLFLYLSLSLAVEVKFVVMFDFISSLFPSLVLFFSKHCCCFCIYYSPD